MKLKIPHADLLLGTYQTRLSQKQIDGLRDVNVHTGGIVLVDPRGNTPDFNAVMLHDMELASREQWELTFTPLEVWAFCVWDSRKSSLNLLVAQCAGQKVAFGPDGRRPSTFTLDGPGVDGAQREAAHSALEMLLRDHMDKPPVRHLMEWLKSTFGAVQKAA